MVLLLHRDGQGSVFTFCGNQQRVKKGNNPMKTHTTSLGGTKSKRFPVYKSRPPLHKRLAKKFSVSINDAAAVVELIPEVGSSWPKFAHKVINVWDEKERKLLSARALNSYFGVWWQRNFCNRGMQLALPTAAHQCQTSEAYIKFRIAFNGHHLIILAVWKCRHLVELTR